MEVEALSVSRQTALTVISEIAKKDLTTLKPETELVADLGIDSPSALKMMVELEERLGIVIEDEDATRLNTVGDVLDYIERATA